MDDQKTTAQRAPAVELPPRQLLFSLKTLAALFDLNYAQIDKLMRRGAFGDDWRSFPWTGRQRRIPRARVLAWAQAADDEQVPV